MRILFLARSVMDRVKRHFALNRTTDQEEILLIGWINEEKQLANTYSNT